MIYARFISPALLIFALLLSCLPPALAIDVCVGEKISLDGTSWRARNLSTTNDIYNLKNIAIANFVVVDRSVPTVETGTLTELEVVDGGRTSTSMDFYFSKSGRYRVIVNREEGEPENFDYNVAVPTVELTRRRVSEVNVYSRSGNPVLQFGNNNRNVAGIDLDFAIAMGRCAGEVGDGQLLAFEDIENLGADENEIYSTQGQEVLDFDPGDVYQPGWHYGFSLQKTANKRFNTDFDDSPSNELGATMLCTSSVDNFRYFLFFKPDSEDSVWIPFSVFDWSVKMAASRANITVDWLDDEVAVSSEVRVADNFSDVIEPWPTWTTYQSAIPAEVTLRNCWSN